MPLLVIGILGNGETAALGVSRLPSGHFLESTSDFSVSLMGHFTTLAVFDLL
jgi:hypothetical protein